MDSKGFLENYQVTDIEKDPLPIKVLRNAITKEEIPGQAIHWGFEYLDQRLCPLLLIQHILEKLYHEVGQTDFSSCTETTDDSLDGGDTVSHELSYEPLKLMRAIVKKLDEICVKEKEDYHDSVDGIVESPDMQPHVFAVSYNNIKNSRRFMEDRMTILPRMDRLFKLQNPVSYFAVFDGHNGSEAAAYGAAQLHQYLIKSMAQQEDVIPSISDAFESLDEAFIQKCRSGKVKSGSTVVLSLIMPGKLYVAWLGDSQAVLVKRNEVNNLVTPHKPERKDEIDRIRSLGGEVIQMHDTYRVNGNLAVSRAIGDADQKTFIISTPDIKMLELDGSEEFLVLGCDGLWDEVSPEASAQIVRREVVSDPHNVPAISQKLIQQAKLKGSQDNITVIVVFFEPLESIKNRYEGVLEPDLQADVVSLKQSPEPLDVIPMDKFIEHGVAGIVPLIPEMNGHTREGDQIVDFLSFGSSKESGTQPIGDDAENQSGDDDMILKKEVEELSDAESDDEWQFEKPSNHDQNLSEPPIWNQHQTEPLQGLVQEPLISDLVDITAEGLPSTNNESLQEIPCFVEVSGHDQPLCADLLSDDQQQNRPDSAESKESTQILMPSNIEQFLGSSASPVESHELVANKSTNPFITEEEETLDPSKVLIADIGEQQHIIEEESSMFEQQNNSDETLESKIIPAGHLPTEPDTSNLVDITAVEVPSINNQDLQEIPCFVEVSGRDQPLCADLLSDGQQQNRPDSAESKESTQILMPSNNEQFLGSSASPVESHEFVAHTKEEDVVDPGKALIADLDLGVQQQIIEEESSVFEQQHDNDETLESSGQLPAEPDTSDLVDITAVEQPSINNQGLQEIPCFVEVSGHDQPLCADLLSDDQQQNRPDSAESKESTQILMPSNIEQFLGSSASPVESHELVAIKSTNPFITEEEVVVEPSKESLIADLGAQQQIVEEKSLVVEQHKDEALKSQITPPIHSPTKPDKASKTSGKASGKNTGAVPKSPPKAGSSAAPRPTATKTANIGTTKSATASRTGATAARGAPSKGANGTDLKAARSAAPKSVNGTEVKAARTAPSKVVNGTDQKASNTTRQAGGITTRTRPAAAPLPPKPAVPKSTAAKTILPPSASLPKRGGPAYGLVSARTQLTQPIRPPAASVAPKAVGDVASKPIASLARAKPKPTSTTVAATKPKPPVGTDVKKPTTMKSSASAASTKPTTTAPRPPITRTVPTSSRTTAPNKPAVTTNKPAALRGAPSNKPAGDSNKFTGPQSTKTVPKPTAPAKTATMTTKKSPFLGKVDSVPKAVKSSVNKKVANSTNEKAELIQQNGMASNEGTEGVRELNGLNGGLNGDINGMNGDAEEKRDAVKENGVHLDDEPLLAMDTTPPITSASAQSETENLLG